MDRDWPARDQGTGTAGSRSGNGISTFVFPLFMPFFPILPDWTVSLPVTLLATVMTVPFNFPSLRQHRHPPNPAFWIHLLLFFQESRCELVKINSLLLLQTDDEITIPPWQPIENDD